ncbi:hypothetical protein Ddc_04369 [Ditylenchus destructor]|nr:hypothetical protein Ddc_04369 [Ditylenchus destructor]
MGMSTGDIESLDHILDMNLKGPIKLITPIFGKVTGCIVNVFSVDGIKPHPEAINCSVSLDHYCRNASALFADRGVRINNRNPGYIHTNIKPRGGVTDNIHETQLSNETTRRVEGNGQYYCVFCQ